MMSIDRRRRKPPSEYLLRQQQSKASTNATRITDLEVNGSDNSSLFNVLRFSDGNVYTYFVGDLSSGSWEAERWTYEALTGKATGVAGTRPATLAELQALTYS